MDFWDISDLELEDFCTNENKRRRNLWSHRFEDAYYCDKFYGVRFLSREKFKKALFTKIDIITSFTVTIMFSILMFFLERLYLILIFWMLWCVLLFFVELKNGKILKSYKVFRKFYRKQGCSYRTISSNVFLYTVQMLQDRAR